ncbi:MAG: DUF839 domain-containing protein, partial [Pyrinomonadaceae bacterium]|nr:DUF839 domain-containing protein [Pyrinomonadaceae bacterium]
MSNHDEDNVSNLSDNETFEEIVASRVSRRGFLGGGLAAAAALSLGGVGSLLNAVPAVGNSRRGPLLGFTGIPVSSADTVVVPDGYTAKVLIAWGDPVSNGPAFLQNASNSAAQQALQWGMHNDGVAYFPIHGSRRGLLVQNNEYIDDVLLFPDGTAGWNQEKTNKALAAHGVSIIEIKKSRGPGNGDDDEDDDDDDDDDYGEHSLHRDRPPREWRVVRPSRFARRITGSTPIKIGGPAAGDLRLKTSADPTGRLVFGTLNNCAMGYTPWGTYLACEENFNGYFRTPAAPVPGSIEARYGLSTGGAGYLLHTTDSRFRVGEEPNEPNRFGWVVEIDPFEP